MLHHLVSADTRMARKLTVVFRISCLLDIYIGRSKQQQLQDRNGLGDNAEAVKIYRKRLTKQPPFSSFTATGSEPPFQCNLFKKALGFLEFDPAVDIVDPNLIALR